MKTVLATILFLLLTQVPVAAQDTDPADDAADAETETSEPADETAPARAEETQTESRRGRPQRFEPSEDISEDLSVSFPVDI